MIELVANSFDRFQIYSFLIHLLLSLHLLAGDSASAHFALPPQWLMPDHQNSSAVYANLFDVVADEADWPHCSWSTGFANATGTRQMFASESSCCLRNDSERCYWIPSRMPFRFT